MCSLHAGKEFAVAVKEGLNSILALKSFLGSRCGSKSL